MSAYFVLFGEFHAAELDEERCSVSPFSRRRFLVTTGLSAAMLPLMSTSALGQSKSPAGSPARTPIRRFITMVVPNGVTPQWFPENGVANQGIRIKAGESSPLKPLEAHKDKIIVMNHMVMENATVVSGLKSASGTRASDRDFVGGHSLSPMVLTGHRGAPGPQQPDGWLLTAGGPSIDVYLGDNMPGAKDLKFRSLALRPTRHTGRGVISYRQQGTGTTPLGVEDDPPALFAKLFADGNVSDEDAKRAAKGEVHILDRVTGHLQAMRNHFGAANAARIDAHLESVRETARSVAILNTCEGLELPTRSINWTNDQYNPDFALITKTQLDLTLNALACDLTRSASIMMGDYANGELAFSFLKDRSVAFSDRRDHHGIAHDDSNGQKNIKPFVEQWFIEQYAYLLDRLSTTLDADGRPLIETTVVLFGNLQDTGVGHKPTNLGWILGGNFDGYFKTGRYLEWPGGQTGAQTPHARLFTSIVNGSGAAQIEYFGDSFDGPKAELAALRG